MEQFSRQEVLQALRAAIRSVRRMPVRINWLGDDRFYIEIRIPRMAERLDIYMAAQTVIGGFGGSDRLIAAIQPLITRFRLPAEDESGNLMQAVYNEEPLPDLPVIQMTPQDLFSDDSAFNASPLLILMLITELMETGGRTRLTSAGMTELMELFPATAQNSANLLEQGSLGLQRSE